MKRKRLIVILMICGLVLIITGMYWQQHRKAVPPTRRAVAVCGRTI